MDQQYIYTFLIASRDSISPYVTLIAENDDAVIRYIINNINSFHEFFEDFFFCQNENDFVLKLKDFYSDDDFLDKIIEPEYNKKFYNNLIKVLTQLIGKNNFTGLLVGGGDNCNMAITKILYSNIIVVTE